MGRGCRIVVCGCIGVGKTTAVRELSSRLEYLGLTEDYAANHFLARFYDDPSRWALPSQLYFVLEALAREREGAEAKGIVQELDTTLVVEVMSRELEARGHLNSDEMHLLREVAALKRSRGKPDLYLYLDASAEVLQKRIAARGRLMELSIMPRELATLRARYRAFLRQVPTSVLTVETERVDVRTSAGQESTVIAITRILANPQQIKASLGENGIGKEAPLGERRLIDDPRAG
jgi:deoxyguanosine kinase